MLSLNELNHRLSAIPEQGLKIGIELLQNIDLGVIVTLDGYHDSNLSNTFEPRIKAIIDGGCRRLVFDCSNFFETDLSFLTGLSKVEKELKKKKGKFSMFGLRGKVREIVDLMGFMKTMHHFEIISEAIKSVT